MPKLNHNFLILVLKITEIITNKVFKLQKLKFVEFCWNINTVKGLEILYHDSVSMIPHTHIRFAQKTELNEESFEKELFWKSQDLAFIEILSLIAQPVLQLINRVWFDVMTH